MSDPPTIRPYTSYNLFFQLEREYILQTLLGFQPTIASKDIFDPADTTYPAEGPPLPSRYENLILPYDWHIPGKTRRHKRSHRKSHGKIHFHEVSTQISKAWSIADDEIRTFCACLSDIESGKYEKDKRKTTDKEEVTRKRDKGKTTVTKLIETETNDDDYNDLSHLFDWTVNFPNFSQDELAIDSSFLDDNIVSSPKICRIVSPESVRVEHEDLYRASNHRESFTEVDMEDDEIIDIWKTTIDEENISFQSFHWLSDVCGNSKSYCNHLYLKEDAMQDDARNSFVDVDYERFEEIEKRLSTTQRLLSKLKRKAFAACQA